VSKELVFQCHQEDYLELADVIEQIVKDVDIRSKRIYKHDAGVFGNWMITQQITPKTLARTNMRDYHVFLKDHYSNATAQRMWSIATVVLNEYVYTNRITTNPTAGLDGFKTEDETTHTVLEKSEAKALIDAIDRKTKKGKRDYALILLLIRTGLRRFEAVPTIGDLQVDQGHHVLIIQEGKGDTRGKIKVPVDVYRAIEEYLEACDRMPSPSDTPDRKMKLRQAPLFVSFRKGDSPTETPLREQGIYYLVRDYAKHVGLDVTPHGLRATFITLALEGEAPLHKVQYAARHKDPRTTERYQKRKQNLDNNAVDYIKW